MAIPLRHLSRQVCEAYHISVFYEKNQLDKLLKQVLEFLDENDPVYAQVVSNIRGMESGRNIEDSDGAGMQPNPALPTIQEEDTENARVAGGRPPQNTSG